MTLSWAQIARLGLVQMSLGAIVVLTTSTLNRLMVIELALPAVLPGALVALHYGIQITRPNWGFKSDAGGHRTYWIIGGMAVLALGGFGAALSVWLLQSWLSAGLVLAVASFALIGLGVGASGTSLLALLATATEPNRRAAAAMITWLMMIFGIAMTAGIAGALLDPYTPERLLRIAGGIAVLAFVMTILAVSGIERRVAVIRESEAVPFREGLAAVWAEPHARAFTIFVFLSMTAYFMQELILEPFSGLVFGLTPGQSTSLSGVQNGGVFLGMLTVGILATMFRFGSLRQWVIAGCLGSFAALNLIALTGLTQTEVMLRPAIVALGFFNGMFAVAAIGSMMALAGKGRSRREGTRMGLWGAAQAIAAGFGGLAGAAMADLLRTGLTDAAAFGLVFGFESLLFVAAAVMAGRIMGQGVPMPYAVPGE